MVKKWSFLFLDSLCVRLEVFRAFRDLRFLPLVLVPLLFLSLSTPTRPASLVSLLASWVVSRPLRPTL